MFIDSHAHLEMPQFDADREAMLARARAAGVGTILAIGSGTGPGSLDCAIKLADQYDFLYASIGIHPHEAKLATDDDFTELAQFAGNPKVIAWGEIGLDYYYDHSPRHVQKEVFIRQMELARLAKLPIIIHCRPSDNSENAWSDCLRLLDEHWASSGLGGILHCFTGSLAHMQAALDMGFMISFAGNITFPKAQDIREAAKQVPLNRMFIETDSPFLAPVPRRGQRNEPAFVTEVARQIGELRRMAADEIGAVTARNFQFFFKLNEGVAESA
ncbi:MAG TPA: TatD family hydrolase [Terriglobales bacterium]|jgi:TatD DNase family protein|nr:TatD family hydrolase [Terriglobales bacterium]